MTETRNQLKSQSIEAVVPATFETVGGRIFPDSSSIDDQLTLSQVVNTWQAAHTPTYGSPIGQSSTDYTAAGQGGEAEVDVVTATKSQVIRIQAIAVANGGGGAPVVCKILIGTVPLVMDLTGAPSTTTPFPITQPIFVDVNSPLKFAVLSGTATDATLLVNGIKVSQ
jgi:hypothetical protein